MFPQIFGKYVLERELASGGMARVYLATLRGAVGFEKRLVVKQIRPELALDEAFVRRFVEEAKIAVELSHPNIVPVYELGVELGVYYIAMELCEGLTLTEVLMDTGPLDAAEGAYVGVEICRALDYAHRRGNIVHRDVTPRNVLLDEEGAVRLIDFGIAAPVSTGNDAARVEVFGSPGHMPLEQIRGERLSPATDVFAVGALLLEAWTGRPPFRRGSFEASAQALNELVPPLDAEHPELSPVAQVIAQAVALRAEDRPQDAEALARKLRDFSRQFDSGDVGRRLGARVRRARRRNRSSLPWQPGDSSGPATPAASPQALFSSRPPPATPATPPMYPLTSATPPGGAPVTRTFAARDDLVEWTRKLKSLPPPAAETTNGGADTPKSPPPTVADSAGPATSALPDGSVAGGRKPLAWLVTGSVAVALGALSFAALRGGAAGGPGPRDESPPGRSAALVPTPAPVAPPATPEPARLLAALSASASPAPSRPAGAGKAVASADNASGLLRLTADPPAVVTVVGGRISQTLSTPVRGLKLPPGSYAVTFRSPTFGEPVAARVELFANASRSVHADFRAALPTVQVR
jgi:eukaryotic-like serine/threonine-protein kinase